MYLAGSFCLFGFLHSRLFFNCFFDFLGDFFGLLKCFGNSFFGCHFCYRLLCNLGRDLFCLCLNGSGGVLGNHFDGARLCGDLCRSACAVIMLGVVTLGCADGLVCGGCGGCARYNGGSRRGNGSRLLDDHGFLNDDGFLGNRLCYRFFGSGFFYGFGLGLGFGLIVVKLPSEVCICGDNGFVLFDQLRYVIGVKLKGDRGLFLTQILANESAGDERFGIGEGILLLVIDLFDIDGRESLLFASTLNKLQSKRELARRVDLVKEGRLGVFLFGANVASTINRILKGRGLKRKIKIQRAGANVDLCDLRVLVGVGINGPAHALLGAFVTHKCVADSTVIFFGSGTGLHQLCLAALAIACNDVASGLLVKAYDALVAKEIAFVLVIVLFCIGFSLCLILGINLILSVELFDFELFVLGIDGRYAFSVFLCGTCNSNLTLHTNLRLELLESIDRLHHFLGYGIGTLILGNSGGVGLLDDLLGGLDNMLLNKGPLSGIGGHTLRHKGLLHGLCGCNCCGSGSNGSFGNRLGRLLCGYFLCNLDSLGNCFCGGSFLDRGFLGKNSILGINEVCNCLLCCLVILIRLDIIGRRCGCGLGCFCLDGNGLGNFHRSIGGCCGFLLLGCSFILCGDEQIALGTKHD